MCSIWYIFSYPMRAQYILKLNILLETKISRTRSFPLQFNGIGIDLKVKSWHQMRIYKCYFKRKRKYKKQWEHSNIWGNWRFWYEMFIRFFTQRSHPVRRKVNMSRYRSPATTWDSDVSYHYIRFSDEHFYKLCRQKLNIRI